MTDLHAITSIVEDAYGVAGIARNAMFWAALAKTTQRALQQIEEALRALATVNARLRCARDMLDDGAIEPNHAQQALERVCRERDGWRKLALARDGLAVPDVAAAMKEEAKATLRGLGIDPMTGEDKGSRAA